MVFEASGYRSGHHDGKCVLEYLADWPSHQRGDSVEGLKMKLSCWALAITGCVIFGAGSHWDPNRGDEPDYWKDHSLVLASVVGTQTVQGFESVKLQAIGTLSGRFDCGETPEVTVLLPQKAFWHTAYPRTGDIVLVILVGLYLTRPIARHRRILETLASSGFSAWLHGWWKGWLMSIRWRFGTMRMSRGICRKHSVVS